MSDIAGIFCAQLWLRAELVPGIFLVIRIWILNCMKHPLVWILISRKVLPSTGIETTNLLITLRSMFPSMPMTLYNTIPFTTLPIVNIHQARQRTAFTLTTNQTSLSTGLTVPIIMALPPRSTLSQHMVSSNSSSSNIWTILGLLLIQLNRQVQVLNLVENSM